MIAPRSHGLWGLAVPSVPFDSFSCARADSADLLAVGKYNKAHKVEKAWSVAWMIKGA